MALFSVTLSYPNSPIFDILYRFSCVRSGWRQTVRLIVASASPWKTSHLWKGLVRSLEPFKFGWAPTTSLDRLEL